MPRNHALGRAEGRHSPCCEQANIKNHTGPSKQRKTSMMRELRRTSDARSDRKGKRPIGEGEFHISLAGPEGQKNG